MHGQKNIKFCHQSLLFINECTSDCLKKNNIKIYITIAPKHVGAILT